MEFFLGAITGIFFVALICGAYLLGRGKRVTPQVIPQEEKDRLEKLQNDFNAMLNYDISKAFKRG